MPAVAGGALVCYATLWKALLSRELEHPQRPLRQRRPEPEPLFTGRLLQDNAHANQAAIHNHYLLPTLSPMILWLGAYGLVVVLAARRASQEDPRRVIPGVLATEGVGQL